MEGTIHNMIGLLHSPHLLLEWVETRQM